MNSRYVVGLGEALWDVLPEGKKLGGAPANFAFHAGQFGLNSIAVSALGEDRLAEETVEQLEEKHLQYCMPRVPYPTGTVLVELDGEGVPTYNIKENVAWDNIPFNDDIKAIAENTQAVCWGSLAQRNVVSRESIYRFINVTPEDCMKIFDINLRQNFYSKEVICESMKRCNVLKINDEELVIRGRMFGYPGLDMENKCWLLLGKYNLDMLILTCGVNGSYVFTRGKVYYQPTPKVVVADTVGAGDSFTGTFCASILGGKSVEEAHRLAVEVSAFVCTQNGAARQRHRHSCGCSHRCCRGRGSGRRCRPERPSAAARVSVAAQSAHTGKQTTPQLLTHGVRRHIQHTHAATHECTRKARV